MEEKTMKGIRAAVCPGETVGASQNQGRRPDIVIAACPNLKCAKVLIDPFHIINGAPAIRLGWRYHLEALRDGRDHLLWASSIWGDKEVETESGVTIREGEVLELFCPECGQVFPTRAYCECQAKMVELRVRKGTDEWDGSIWVCARRRCFGHKKVRAEEYRAVQQAAAGLEWMCGGGSQREQAALRVAEANRPR